MAAAKFTGTKSIPPPVPSSAELHVQQRIVPLPEGPTPQPPQRIAEKGRRRIIPSTSSSPFPPPLSPSSCIRCRHRARLFLQPGIAAGAALPPPGAAAWLEGPGGAGGSGGRCRTGPGSPALYGRAVHAAAAAGPGSAARPRLRTAPGRSPRRCAPPATEGGQRKTRARGDRKNCVNMYVWDIFPPGRGLRIEDGPRLQTGAGL